MSKNNSKSLHRRKKTMSAPLSSELRERYGFRSISVREGDKVRLTQGEFEDVEGEVSDVDTDSQRIVIEGVETVKADETEVSNPVHPSNVEITGLEKDRMREKIIERRSEGGKEWREETSEETEPEEFEETESAENKIERRSKNGEERREETSEETERAESKEGS